LKIITIDGELLTIGGSGLDSAGYDLLALMTGSEGMLGVIVEVTVKLLPKPERTQVLLAAFDDVVKAGEAVGNIIAAGIIPGGLEMMDRLAIRAAEDFVHAGYPLSAEAILLCELDGTNEEVSQHVLEVREVLRQSGASEVRTARDEAERQVLWQGRKSAFPAVGRLSPDYYCMDGTIPRKQLPRVLKAMADLSAEYELPVANVFHAGDGNLHPLILYDAGNPDAISRAERFGADILELSVRVGGAITGEHGVGVEKMAQMQAQFSEPELLQMEDIKAAFDPKLVLNPGKGIPILRRCQEYRALPPRNSHDR
jgi:glycolate oxidase